MYSPYSLFPSWVLGFHGCDESVAEKLLTGKHPPLPSRNTWDWLGSGIYFWENSPSRALDWAQELKKHPERSTTTVRRPAVVGAIISLGYCLNLLDAGFAKNVRQAYETLKEVLTDEGQALPYLNKRGGLRQLDCEVINTLHLIRDDRDLRRFDSVRAAFIEGKPLYESAGFHERTHIQICVRSMNCIKGYFRPLTKHYPPIKW